MRSSLASAAVLALALSLSAGVRAVSLGEIDTFSADLEDWFAGGGPLGQVPPLPPTIVPSGGPAGAGDSFLQIASNGSTGPGGRLVAMNGAQWAGDYTAAGVFGIAMDLRNFGTADLTVRLFFEDPTAGPPLNQAVTTQGVQLPVGSGWVHAVFAIGPADLTVLQGDAATLLSNTTLLRIFHGVDPAFPGAPIAGLLGVDNIQAIPEPDTLALLALGAGLVAVATRRRRST